MTSLTDTLSTVLSQAIKALQSEGVIPADVKLPIPKIDRTPDPSHGDYASNIAMLLAKPCKMSPRALAEKLIAHIDQPKLIEALQIAGPGFINFHLSQTAFQGVIPQIFAQKARYGCRDDVGQGKKIVIEFVSANPTGPLHVGHGRGAAIGATLANLLTAVGYQVLREYYVNDAGRQMDILAVSVWLRYLEHCGLGFSFPVNAYKGLYVQTIAQQLFETVGKAFERSVDSVMQNLPLDEQADGSGDKEAYIDALIARAKTLLGQEAYQQIFNLALNDILEDIRSDLADFGVCFDRWFHESELKQQGAIEQALSALQGNGFVYEKDGALWFKATHFGDEKDRVLVRENGQPTYFAADVAYHFNKFERGFDQAIDVFGADHHGYISRIKASVEALGKNPEQLILVLVQFAILYRGQERVQMSTRSGSFVTLRELREEVGNDAARFFYVMRKAEQHMDFDLDLAKSQSNDNPVYYVQYAHARICSVLRQAQEQGLLGDEVTLLGQIARLDQAHEKALLMELADYPDVLRKAAESHEPHQLAFYLRDLANRFHAYYNAHIFLVKTDPSLTSARLALCQAVQHVLKNGLTLLGVSAPEEM